MGASTNAMEISQEVERAQLSPMVHVGHALEVTGAEDLARMSNLFLAILLFVNILLIHIQYCLTTQKYSRIFNSIFQWRATPMYKLQKCLP